MDLDSLEWDRGSALALWEQMFRHPAWQAALRLLREREALYRQECLQADPHKEPSRLARAQGQVSALEYVTGKAFKDDLHTLLSEQDR